MLESILTFIAGIGLFLFSISFLSKSIETIYGNKIRKSFNKISDNRFKNIGLGFGVCFFMQSTTATMMLVIGFSSMGALTLFQGISIVIGANLASGLSPYLVSFSSFSLTNFFCAFAGVGAFMQIFSKKTFVKQIANVIVAFSLIFIGLQLISNATEYFKTNEMFLSFFTTLTNPILLMLFGLAFTVLIQSSLGTIAILASLLGTSQTPGVITLESAVFVFLGAVVGTCLSTLILGLLSAKNSDSKKIVLFHFIMNFTGVIFFGLLSIIDWWNILSFIKEPAIILATISLIFNIFNVICFIPLIKPVEYLLKKLTPHKNKKPKTEFEFNYDENEPKALTLAKLNEKTILYFKELKKLFNKICNFVVNSEENKKLKNDITKFLDYTKTLQSIAVKIPSSEANKKENKYVENILITIKQIERDTSNLNKIYDVVFDEDGNKINYSNKISNYINKLTEKILNIFDLSLLFIEKPDCDFNATSKPDYASLLDLNEEVNKIISSAKKYIIKNGFNSELSIIKNTRYLSVLNYMSVVSNNLIDNAFIFECEWQENHKNNYQQLEFDIKNEESA